MEGMSSSELQEELNSTLVLARQKSLNLWGLIRKIPSVNSVVLKKRDEAKEELDAYVVKLSESLMDFSCDVTESIDRLLKEKQSELDDLRKRYENDVETLVKLCTEAEGLLQFGKNLENSSNKAKAAELIKEIQASLSRPISELGMRNLFNVTILKTLQPDEISPRIFGQLIQDSGSDKIKHGCTLKQASEQHNRTEQNKTSQDDSTQTANFTDESVQTEDLTTTSSSINNVQLSPCHTNQFTSPPGFYQGANPLHIHNTHLDNLSSSFGYNVVPVNTFVQSSGIGTFEDPVVLYYGNVVGTANQNVIVSPGINTLNSSMCPPGFPTSPQYGIQNQIHQIDCGSPYSPATAEISGLASQNIQAPSHSSKNESVNSNEGRESYQQGTITSSPSNFTERNSVYIPPKLPKFVKDLEKQFDGTGTAAERKPLRKPFGAPPGLKQETSNAYQHSTPIRHKTQAVETETLDLQSIGQELIDSSIKAAGSTSMSGEVELSVPNVEEHIQTLADDYVEVQKFDTDSQMSLRDYVKKTYPLSPTEKNRQVLKSQTQWCKGYLSQILTSNRKTLSTSEKMEANDDKNVIMIKDSSERGESWDTEIIDVSVDPHIDLTKIPDSPSQNVIKSYNLRLKDDHSNDMEGISVKNLKINTSTDDSGIFVTEKKEVDSSVIEKTGEQSLQFNESVRDVDKMSESKDAKNQVLTEITAEVKFEAKTELMQDTTAVVNKHCETSDVCQQANKRVKQKHGDSRCTNNRSRSIGPLQAHWLTCHPGTYVDLEMQFQFKISHNFHFPIGVSSDREGNIYVTDTGNHVVKKFNQSGEFLLEFGKDIAMKRPSAVVVNDSGDIFVKDDMCIRKFDKTGRHELDIGKNKFKKPFGLAMTPAKYLLVLDTHYSNPYLIHISQDGEIVMEFLYRPLLNCHPQTKCRFMGVSDNNVIVSDLGLSQIYITNLEGVFLKRFGCYGSDMMQFWEPSGITVDNYGNVLIGDSKNNRIQIYRYDGSYTGLLTMDKPIYRPSGIHLTADNKLLIVNFLDHSIKVYNFVKL